MKLLHYSDEVTRDLMRTHITEGAMFYDECMKIDPDIDDSTLNMLFQTWSVRNLQVVVE